MIRVLQKGNTHNGASGQLYAVSCVRAHEFVHLIEKEHGAALLAL